MFPHFAIDFTTLSGKLKPAKEISVHPPMYPYLVLPANGNGAKPVRKSSCFYFGNY
jgi:hypothetical protein